MTIISKTIALATLLACSVGVGFADDLYREQHRPQVHYSPPQKWMNDPNGMVYYDGQYHLFYQYHPYGNTWGPMHWGHAVSKNLVHWDNLPIGLFPDRNGAIWSGSAVVDQANTTGFGTEGKPPLVAVFTQHDHLAADLGKSKRFQSQGIAYSLDNGRSWQMYEANPVLESPDIPDFRDPKVFWYAPENKWVMSLAVRDHIRFYSSPDLKKWEMTGRFGDGWGSHEGVWECPDLIRLDVEGEDTSRYVLLVSVSHGGPNGGSATQYYVGDFDGKSFTLDEDEAQRMRATPEAFPNGTIFDDFEGDLSGWDQDDEVFGIESATDGDGITNRFASSGQNGEEATGTLRSEPFRISKPFVNFRLSGRAAPDQLGMRLIIDGAIVRTATGDQLPRPQVKSWDVSEFVGSTAVLEIYDNIKGPWGIVVVDDIMFADGPASGRQAPAKWLDYGTDNYAGVTWSNVPDSDGRTLFIGWMSNWKYAQIVPTERWRSAMTLSRELDLVRSPRGLEVHSSPVAELKSLRIDTQSLPTGRIQGERVLADRIDADAFEVSLSLMVDANEPTEIIFSNQASEQAVFRVDPGAMRYELDRSKSGEGVSIDPCKEICVGDVRDNLLDTQIIPLRHRGNKLDLRVVVDHSSLEVFINDGETVISALVFPGSPYDRVTARARGTSSIDSARLHRLSSIWKADDERE